MYNQLLELCGLEPEEIKKELPRIERAFQKWGITDKDIARAESRIKKYFDYRLRGMRKFLGLWLMEFVDLTLAREEGKTIVYPSYPPFSQIAATIATMSDDLYACVPECTIMAVMGQIFGKIVPTIEAGEQTYMPPGQAHCILLAIRLGAMLEGKIPIPDMLIPSGTTCDQSGKTDEIVQELYGTPVVHLDAGFDCSGQTTVYADALRVRYVAQELQNLAREFRSVTGHEITEKGVEQGIKQYGLLRGMYYEIQDLLKADPMPLSTKDFGIIGLGVSSCLRRFITGGLSAGKLLVAELKERIARGEGILPKGVPRVMVYFPHMADPAVTGVVEDLGLAIAVTTRSGVWDKAPSPYDSIWEKAADQNLRRGSRHSTASMINELKDIARTYQVDGLILDVLAKCRVHTFYPLKAKEIIEKELGIPVLVVEHDHYDTRDYSAERYRSRIEPFAEILKARKAAKVK